MTQETKNMLVRCVELHRAMIVLGLEPMAWVMSPDVKCALADSVTPNLRFPAESTMAESLDGLPIFQTEAGVTERLGFLWQA